MAYSFIGSAAAVSTVTAISYSSQGNSLIVAMIKSGSSIPTGVQDNNGNAFTAVPGFNPLVLSANNDGYSRMLLFYLLNAPAATSYSMVNANITNSWRVAEYSGIALSGALITTGTAFQGSPSSFAGTGTDAISSGPVTVSTGLPALILGLLKGSQNGGFSAGTGYTGRVTSNGDWLVEDQRATSSGTYTITATNATHGGTDDYQTTLLAFSENVGVNISPNAGSVSMGSSASTVTSGSVTHVTPFTARRRDAFTCHREGGLIVVERNKKIFLPSRQLLRAA